MRSSVSDLHFSLVDLRHKRMGLRSMAPKAARLFEDPWAVRALEHATCVGLNKIRRSRRFLDLLAFSCNILLGTFHLLGRTLWLGFSNIFSFQRYRL